MGMELAREEINAAAGVDGHKLVVRYEDSQSEPKTATSALLKLIISDHIQVVIGDIASSSVLAMAPIAEKHQVVLLSPGASNPDISQAGKFIFRNWQSDALEGEAGARHAFSSLGWRRVASLYVNNAYGAGLNKVFSETFTALGGQIIAQEPFPQGTTDVRAQIARVATATPDGIYLPGYPPEMAIALKQMRETGVHSPVLSVQAFDDPEIVARAGPAAEGVIYSVPKPPDQASPVTARFRERYVATYGKQPGVCSDTGYDAVRIIAWAMEQGALTGPKIRDKLSALQNFAGAAGPTTFDSNGDVIRDFIFKRVTPEVPPATPGHIPGVTGRSPSWRGSNDGTPPPPGEETVDDKVVRADRVANPGEPHSADTQNGHRAQQPEEPGAFDTIIKLMKVIGPLFAAGGGVLLYRFRFWVWVQVSWCRTILAFRLTARHRKRGLRIVTIDDYVQLLEAFRQRIAGRCHGAKPSPTIVIRIFTMQLPRDWPLWNLTTASTPDLTALERYFFDFSHFLKHAPDGNYKVDLKRVIVIDNKDGPDGKERISKLTEDVNSTQFSEYLRKLHNSDDEALYLEYARPWPGWLSDAVCYGFQEENHALKWLYAVTTSYNAREDLVLLRYHRLARGRLDDGLVLPGGRKTLAEFAKWATESDFGAKKLSALSTGPSGTSARAA
jgi:branched-chain amino acid transport system substrate-binding protein